MTSHAYPTSWQPPKFIPNPYARYGLLLAAVLYIVWSVGALDIDWHRVDQGMTRAAKMFARMVPPDFSRWQLLASGLIESVQMALAASFIGMLLAIPLAV